MKDIIDEIGITEKQLEEFINSSQEVVLGYIGSDLVYDCYYSGDFICTPSFNQLSVDDARVYIYKGEASDYPQNAYIIEGIQEERPKACFIKSDGNKIEVKVRLIGKDVVEPTRGNMRDIIDEIGITEKQLEEFINSSQEVVIGHIGTEMIYAPPYDGCFLYIPSFGTSRVDDACVYIYKGEASDYPQNAYIIEGIQEERPKACFIKSDGNKIEVKVRLIGKSVVEPNLTDVAIDFCGPDWSLEAELMKQRADDKMIPDKITDVAIVQEEMRMLPFEVVPCDGSELVYDSAHGYDDWSGPHVPSEWDNMEHVFIYECEMQDFIKSAQMMACGSRVIQKDLLYDNVEGTFYHGAILYPQQSANSQENNVLFFKGKAVDYKPNTYVVEDVQSEHLKAFYVEEDGAKRELVLRLL